MAEGSRQKTVRIGVVEHGRPRALATLAEMVTGDVIVDLRARRFLSDVPVPFASPETVDVGSPITEFRFTIHPSINSPESINVINLHVTTTDEPRVTNRHLTPAIKEQPGRFSFLFSRLYPVLSDPTYDFAKPTEQFESIGSNDLSFTVAVVAFVTNPATQIQLERGDFKLQIYRFKSCAIVIASAFFTGPPYQYSRVWSCVTQVETGPSESFDIEGLERLTLATLIDLKLEYQQILIDRGGFEDILPFIASATFLAEPTLNSAEAKEWRQVLRDRGIA